MIKIKKSELEQFLLRNYILAINCAINAAGILGLNIFLVGGIVRDLLLKNPIKDIDITVEGDALLFCKYLENNFNCKIIAIQENLHTAKVEFSSGIIIDFASTREEFYLKEGQLPVLKNFGCSLMQDVKRRDFTINTLALELNCSNEFYIKDYFNGLNDIWNKKIKVLHNNSFIDDPSRIIRAIKFQKRLDFNIDEETLLLIKKYLENPDISIPMERIKNELKQYFSLEKTELYQNLIDKKIYKIFTNNPIKTFNVNAFECIKKYLVPKDIWFIYFAHILINADLEMLHLNLTSIEKKILYEIKELININTVNSNDNVIIYNNFNKKSEISLCIYYMITEDKSVLKFMEKLKDIKVLITGNDLIKIGLKPSPYFSELLKQILNEKLKGKLKTLKDELKYVKNIIKLL